MRCGGPLRCRGPYITLDLRASGPETDVRSSTFSCDCNHAIRSARAPRNGRAHRVLLNGLASAPVHQYSLVTIRLQLHRPEQLTVMISMLRPCRGLVKLSRSRSNCAPSWVQCASRKPGFVVGSSRSNIRKKEGRVRLLMHL